MIEKLELLIGDDGTMMLKVYISNLEAIKVD